MSSDNFSVKPLTDSTSGLNATGGYTVASGWSSIDEYEGSLASYLATFVPQANNLFFTSNFCEYEGCHEFFNSAYRIRSVSTPQITLNFKTNVVSRAPQLTDVNYDTNVEIAWLEDVYKSCWRYHEDWLKRWYNKDFDVLRTGLFGKYRMLDVFTYGYFNNVQVGSDDSRSFTAEDSGADSIMGPSTPIPILWVRIRGLVPTGSGIVKVDKEQDGCTELFVGKYKCSKFNIYYNSLLTGKSKAYPNDVKDIGNTTQQDYPVSGVSSPVVANNSQASTTATAQTADRILVARTATNTYGNGMV